MAARSGLKFVNPEEAAFRELDEDIFDLEDGVGVTASSRKYDRRHGIWRIFKKVLLAFFVFIVIFSLYGYIFPGIKSIQQPQRKLEEHEENNSGGENEFESKKPLPSQPPYKLLAGPGTTLAQMMSAIPMPPAPAALGHHFGCQNGGTTLKDTNIPCRVAITDRTVHPFTCWDNTNGVKVDFSDNAALLSLIKNNFPDLWDYVDPGRKNPNEANPKQVTWVQRADIWRYAEIYQNGGIYADADACPQEHADDWVDLWTVPNRIGDKAADSASDMVDVILGIEGMEPTDKCGWPYTPMQFNQWTFAASPRSPVMFHVLQQLNQQMLLGQPNIIANTGPRIFSRAILDFIAEFGPVKGFRTADGIPNAMTGIINDGKSKVIQCDFHGKNVSILIMGYRGMAEGAYAGSLDETQSGEKVLQHQFAGSWKTDDDTDCDCRFIHCHPWYTELHPRRDNYKRATSFPLSADYQVSDDNEKL